MARHQVFHHSTVAVCLAAAIFLTTAAEAAGPLQRQVRLNLHKKTNDQKGGLGQPLTSYYANIDVGTPPRPYKMLVDVNAREIWLPHISTLGRVFSRLNYKDGYSKKNSKTSIKEDSEVYTITYKGVELSGKAYRDVFEFKNITESFAPVRYEQRFLAISSASNDQFSNYGVDGVIPLNPWPISETGSDLILVGLARANLTDGLKFGLALDTDENSEHGGELTLGGANPAKYLGALRFHQVRTQHSWELHLTRVMLGAESVACTDVECTALLSTNTNDIYGPSKYVRRILSLLGVDSVSKNFDDKMLYEIDCLKVANAPSIAFAIDDAYYVLHPLSYIKKRVSGVIFKTTTCYVSILSNGSENHWELGTNFLANYYTVFDVNKRQVALGVRTP